MITKKQFKFTIIPLLLIIFIQTLIINRPFIKHPVTTPENAIIIAKAELIRRYGEAEVLNLEFKAVRLGDFPNNWYIIALPLRLDDQPYILVRIADGRVKMRWK